MNKYNALSADAFSRRAANAATAKNYRAGFERRGRGMRAQLADDVAAFLARGGAIQVIPAGVSAVEITPRRRAKGAQTDGVA